MHVQRVLMPVLVLAAASLTGCKDPKGKQTKPVIAPTAPVNKAEPVAPPLKETPEPERPKLVRAQPLPQMARASLRKRMQNHGDDTENLLWSTLMLDYESTDGIAARISKAPTLARPQANELDTVNAMLPPEFFDMQDRLTVAVDTLRAAAKAKDDGKMAEQYSQVVETCINCHSLFLQFPTPE